MKIQIEDYNGNDVVIIDYCLKDKSEVKKSVVNTIEGIAHNHGYNVADLDDDATVRVQQCDVSKAEANEEKVLVNLINDLNTYFIKL